jgi:hypothetical protein
MNSFIVPYSLTECKERLNKACYDQSSLFGYVQLKFIPLNEHSCKYELWMSTPMPRSRKYEYRNFELSGLLVQQNDFLTTITGNWRITKTALFLTFLPVLVIDGILVVGGVHSTAGLLIVVNLFAYGTLASCWKMLRLMNRALQPLHG